MVDPLQESKLDSARSMEIDRLEIKLSKELAYSYAKHLKKGTCVERAWDMWYHKNRFKYFNSQLGEGTCSSLFRTTWMNVFRHVHPICKDALCDCCDDPLDSIGSYKNGVMVPVQEYKLVHNGGVAQYTNTACVQACIIQALCSFTDDTGTEKGKHCNVDLNQVEHPVFNWKVVGSNPTSLTF